MDIFETVAAYIGLYFFSAVFQGNMALLALLGVFVVFKQQMLSTELREKGNDFTISIREFLNLKVSMMVSSTQPHHYLLAFSYRSFKDIPGIIEDMAESRGYPGYLKPVAISLRDDPNYKKRIEEIKELECKRKKIIGQLKRPFISFLIVIILSLAMLPLIALIHKASICFEILMIVCTFIINIWVLVETTRFVWKMLKD